MAFKTTVVGSYPKPPAEGETFHLRKTLHALEKGQASRSDLERAFEDLVRDVVSEQESAGIDIVTDGQVRWDDILTPFARVFEGFEIGGLLRWFNNNTYYRRPICTGPIEWRGPSSVEAWRYADSVASKPVKAVIPGPVTFARGSIDEHYGDHESFVLAIADILAQEAFELEAAGAQFIQIDEPALLDAPEDFELARRALTSVTGQLSSATTTLATYFGDAKRLGPELFELPVDVFGLDFVSGPANAELVDDIPRGKTLQAGIVDARNTKLESIDDLARTVGELVDKRGAELILSPSCGLDYLPREKARAKLGRLSEVAAKVGG